MLLFLNIAKLCIATRLSMLTGFCVKVKQLAFILGQRHLTAAFEVFVVVSRLACMDQAPNQAPADLHLQ